jgi:thioredoxin reductase (NADPH)
MPANDNREALIIGGGLAGLCAAIYLGRARRKTLLIDSGKSMARWEPEVQNYLGFPHGISGADLLTLGRHQARAYGVDFAEDELRSGVRENGCFVLEGRHGNYRGSRLLLATGAFHIPPDIEGVKECLGHSIFFCKDCDAYRVQGKRLAIYGRSNEAAEYALAMLSFSSHVVLVTDGQRPAWDQAHAEWLSEYGIRIYAQTIVRAAHQDNQLQLLCLSDGNQIRLDALFTTRGDIYLNKLAKGLGANLDAEGQIVIDANGATNVPGLYAAGCVTPANCQMIIAAGQGAVAAQAMNKSLFEESLRNHSLRRRAEPASKPLVGSCAS